MHWSRKWQPTPVFLAGESQGWGACWASVCGIAQSRTRLKQLSSSSSSIVNITPYFSWIYKREIARLWDKCMSDNASFPIWLCHYISTSTEFLFFFFFLSWSMLWYCIYCFGVALSCPRVCVWPCHVAYGISVPQPRIEPGPWQWKPGILTTKPLGNSLC